MQPTGSFGHPSRRSRRTGAFLALAWTLALAGAAVATHAPDHPDLIVPGERIGPARLGMTAEELLAAMQPINDGTRAGCPVEAEFADGRAVRLETAWGGACMTAEGVQVGIPFGVALLAYGRPLEEVGEGAYLRQDGTVEATASWFRYRGIAFRVVIPAGLPAAAGVITTVAVFR
jgi:hypothetical protein